MGGSKTPGRVVLKGGIGSREAVVGAAADDSSVRGDATVGEAQCSSRMWSLQVLPRWAYQVGGWQTCV